MSTNDIPSWVPSVLEMRDVYLPGEHFPWTEAGFEKVRSLVASRVPKPKEEVYVMGHAAIANGAGATITSLLDIPATTPFLDHAKFDAEVERLKVPPARESVDVERDTVLAEMADVCSKRAEDLERRADKFDDDDSKRLERERASEARYLAASIRSRIGTAPPRDSSPAASGEVETARDIMDRHVSAAMHEKYAGLEAAAEKKVREIVRAETRIFDMCIGILDQRVSKLEVARDSSAAESAPISTDEGEMKACPWCDKSKFTRTGGRLRPGGAFVSCADENCPGSQVFAQPAEWNRRAPAPEAEREKRYLTWGEFDAEMQRIEREKHPRLRDLLRTVEERGPDIEAIITEFRLLFDENTKPMTIMYAQQRVRRAYEIALLALARGEESEGGK